MTENTNSIPITKVPKSDALSLFDLYKFLKKWRKENPEAHRIDGKSVTIANPGQWVFFIVEDLKEKDFSGKEMNDRKTNGKDWNGFYFLTGQTRGKAIDEFIRLYDLAKGDPSNIFELAYTRGKEGNPKKRKLLLKGTTEETNEWFCKQYNSSWS